MARLRVSRLLLQDANYQGPPFDALKDVITALVAKEVVLVYEDSDSSVVVGSVRVRKDGTLEVRATGVPDSDAEAGDVDESRIVSTKPFAHPKPLK